MQIIANTGDIRLPYGFSGGGGGGGGNYQTDVSANGVHVGTNTAVDFISTPTINVQAAANGTYVDVSLSANITGVTASAQNTVATYVNGTLVLPNANINLVNSATIIVAGAANGTGRSNVTLSVNTSAIANQQIVWGTASYIDGEANLVYNTASKSIGSEANLQLANASALYFGGGQANIANAPFKMFYNAAANSVDIVFV